MTHLIAIVGRPNVGKSTLFNRLSRSKDALVDDRPGITRDRLYASVQWGGKGFTLVDTGGFDDPVDDPLIEQVRGQVQLAVADADRIIFMVDGRQGIMPGDEDIAALLRLSAKEVYLAVNKVDGPEHDGLLGDFYALGQDRVFPLSAAHGYGLRNLMDALISDLPEEHPSEPEEDSLRIAILGRPNVGKSSLINRLVGSERLVVSQLPGTTRDSVDIRFSWRNRNYLLIDTAGLRRKARVKERIDKFSMIKALRTLDRCHVAVVVLDASMGVVEQDARICGYALERGRALILALNKWDLIKKDPDGRRRLADHMDRHLKFASFAPRLSVSAMTGERVKALLKQIEDCYAQFSRRVGTGEVNRILEKILQVKPPPLPGRGKLKFFYATQASTKPPTFVVFVNRPEVIHFSYERFLINQLRDHLKMDSTPIKLVFKKKQQRRRER